MHSIKLWITVSIMLLWANKCLTPFLKVEKSVVGFCIFVYQVKTYAFLVNEIRCWESCWLSAQKKLTVFALPFQRYTRLYGHIEHRSKLYDRSKYLRYGNKGLR